jgi:cytochrome c
VKVVWWLLLGRASSPPGGWLPALLCLVTAMSLAGCGQASEPEMPGADPTAGREAMVGYGCGACHTIAGVIGAHARVGPPLERFARRGTIAGKLSNTPDNLTVWIQHPQQVGPGVDMPELGVSPADARSTTSMAASSRSRSTA